MELDPVCGMKVNREAAQAKVEHGGETYYFCCGGCAERFRKSPERYILAAAALKNAAAPMTEVLPTPKPGHTSLSVFGAPPQEKDPVCGMMVGSGSPAGKVDYEGKTYFFCSTRCAERFEHEPERFLLARRGQKTRSSCCWRRLSSFGVAGRSLNVSGVRSCDAARTCSR